MRTKRGPGKTSFRVAIAFVFFVSLFLFAPQAFAASYRYDSVDVDIDCISNDEVNVTVDIKVDMTSVLCWWVNYGGSTNISTKLTSVEAGMSKTSMKNLVLKSNGAKYKNEGAPPKDTAAYDSGDLLVYIAGSTFETYSQRFSGTAYIRYKTTLSNLAGSSMWRGNDFSLTPFTTNDSSTVPKLTVTVNNADKLTGRDICDQLAYIGGVYTIHDSLKLCSSDGKTLKFTGDMGKKQTSNIFLSSEPIPAITKVWREYTHTNLFLTCPLFLILLIVLYVALFKVVGKRTPKELRGFYYRDIPKSDNPIQAAYRALTYRTPYSLDKDAIKEQDLIAYILLKNKDEGKAQFDENEIKVKLREIDRQDRSVYEWITLKKLSKILEEKNNLLRADKNGVTTINTHAIKEYGEQIEDTVHSMPSWRLKEYARDLMEYQQESLLDNFVDRKRPKTNFSLFKSSKAIVGLIICFLLLELYVVLIGSTWLVFAHNVILCSVGVVLIVRFIRKIKETCTDEEMASIKQVIGLKNWIEDFTTINEQQPRADIVWGDFIKWAYLLGVSEKAIKIAEEYASSHVVDNIAKEISALADTATSVASCAGIASSVSSSIGSTVASSVASSGGGSGGGGGGGGGCR